MYGGLNLTPEQQAELSVKAQEIQGSDFEESTGQSTGKSFKELLKSKVPEYPDISQVDTMRKMCESKSKFGVPMVYDKSSHNCIPDIQLLEATLSQLDPFYESMETMTIPERVAQMMPSELPPNVKEALVNANIRGTKKELDLLYDNYVKPQYQLWYNEIRPNLIYIKQLRKYTNMAQINSDYYDNSNDIIKFLYDKVKQTEASMEKYMASRKGMMEHVYTHMLPTMPYAASGISSGLSNMGDIFGFQNNLVSKMINSAGLTTINNPIMPYHMNLL